MRLGWGMSRVAEGKNSKDIEHKHLFLLMGVWGGAHGLFSHLDNSSIFKRDLIETNPHFWISQAFPPALAMTGISPLCCQSIPKQGASVTLSRQVYSIPAPIAASFLFNSPSCLHWIQSFIFLRERGRENKTERTRKWEEYDGGPLGKGQCIRQRIDQFQLRWIWAHRLVYCLGRLRNAVLCTPRLRGSEAAGEEGREGGNHCITKQTLSSAHQSQGPSWDRYRLLIELFLEWRY